MIEGKVPLWYWIGIGLLLAMLSVVAAVSEVMMGAEVLR